MVVSIVLAVLNAIAAIPAIAGYLQQAVQAIVGWYIDKQNNDTLAEIADAAAFAARASNDEERYQAAEKWRQALSRSRISA